MAKGLIAATPNLVPGDFTVLNGNHRDRLETIHIDIMIGSQRRGQNSTIAVANNKLAAMERDENEKFAYHKDGGETGLALREMNRRQHGYIPFVVNSFGVLGPCAGRLLYGSSVRLGKERDTTGITREDSTFLMERSTGKNSLVNVLGKANKAFFKNPHKPECFSPGSNVVAPRTWAQYHLSTNLVHAIACHIRYAKNKHELFLRKSEAVTRYGIRGRIPSYRKRYSLKPMELSEDLPDLFG